MYKPNDDLKMVACTCILRNHYCTFPPILDVHVFISGRLLINPPAVSLYMLEITPIFHYMLIGR